MVGLIRGHEMMSGRINEVYQKLFRRALTIYVWSISLTIFYTFLSNSIKHYVPIKPEIISDTSFWFILWNTLTLRYSYGWADFLNYYAVFLLGAIPVLFLLNKGKTWLVLFLSVSLWLLREYNFYFAWQILFVIGIVVGYFFHRLEKNFIALSLKLRLAVCFIFLFITIGTLITSALIVYFSEVAVTTPLLNIINENANIWFDKMTLAPGRLFLAVMWFTTLFAFVRHYEDVFMRRLGWFLVPIGRNSLFVYIFQSVLIYVLYPMLSIPSGFSTNFLINLFSIVLVWFAARHFIRYRFVV